MVINRKSELFRLEEPVKVFPREQLLISGQFFSHAVAIIAHKIPPGIRRDAMIGARNVTAKFHQRFKPLDFSVNCRAVSGEDVFIHATHATQVLAVLLAPRGDRGVPCAHLDRKHRVHAILEPSRNQRVNHPVAVQ